jgi:diadenylate cyclase
MLAPLRGLLDRFTLGGGFGLARVLLEMLLIGGVVYASLRFLQGTRGARLMRSIGLIIVVSFIVVRLVAAKLELDRISYLYPYFLGAVFLITLIVFQSELRRGLLMLGGGWWSGAWAKQTGLIIEPIVEAAAHLSKRKVGALIAIERSVGIAGVTESGKQIDGEVSAELLEAIFWPGAVLHDMGVVIREGRLVAASCQFPLTDSEDVDLSLGSRHRAALGLSEESDALIVVVSEETGTISVAEHGRLRRSLSADSLRQILQDSLIPAEKEAWWRRRRAAKSRPRPAASPTKPQSTTTPAKAEKPDVSSGSREAQPAKVPLTKAEAGT